MTRVHKGEGGGGGGRMAMELASTIQILPNAREMSSFGLFHY